MVNPCNLKLYWLLPNHIPIRILPTTPSFPRRSRPTRQLKKIAGHQRGRRFSVEVTCRGHNVQDNSKTLFSKTTQACGCPPRPVATFLHQVNQACTGICGPSLVWNHLLTKTQIDQLEAIQRQVLRII